MMSKNAWSPGRMRRSLNTCGCGLHLSPDTALMLSTCSEPISNNRCVTSATSSFSRIPGLRCSAMYWYAPSTMAQAVFSRMISSIDLTSGVEHHLLRVANGQALRLEGGDHRWLDDIDAERHVRRPLRPEDPGELLGSRAEQTCIRRDRATEPDHPGVDVLRT